ncbi:acetyl-CoA synthetase-like protein, partial [Cucurbitaria berberidis CBS 394.84]
MSSSLGSALAFWQAQFKQRPPTLPMLPFATRGFRNPDAIPAFHRFEAVLPTEDSMNLRFASMNLNHTEMHFGLAALQVLLMHLTGAEDFVIGIGRTVGNKSDVMPVRFKADLEKSFEELLALTKETLRRVGRYLHVPVKSLLSALEVSRQTLLHQVTFDWLPNSIHGSQSMDMYFQHSQDLVLLVREDDHRNLRVSVAVQEHVFEKEHAQLIAEIYIKLLGSLAIGSEGALCAVDILGPRIRERSRNLGTGPHVESSAESILMQISEVTEKVPSRVAAEDQYGNQITYIQLVQRAIAISTVLQANGVTKATPVCVLGSPTIDLLCGILAIWCAEGIYVPLDYHESVKHNSAIVDNCGTDICLVRSPRLVQYAQSIGLRTTLNCPDLQFIEGVQTIDKVMPNDVAVALHAPASDKSPKGIMLTHGNLMSMVAAAKYYFEVEHPVVLQHTNWVYDHSLFQILFALTSGGKLVLAPTPEDLAEVPKVIARQKVTVTVATPSEYSMWFQSNSDALESCSSWKLAFCGGENMTSSMTRHFAALGNNNLELVGMYGTTETSVVCSMGVVGYREYAAESEGKLIPVGPALPNNVVWIADQYGRPIPPGWIGEIWVGGSGISTGYFGPDVDDDMFCVDDETGVRSFRTLDRGFLNDRGILFVVSRDHDNSNVQLRGHFINLNDIARAIIDQSNGKIAEAVVILTQEDEPQVQVFVALSRAPTAESPRYLQAMLRSLNLPSFMRPSRAIVIEALPLTPAGKIDRFALQTRMYPDTQIIQI